MKKGDTRVELLSGVAFRTKDLSAGYCVSASCNRICRNTARPVGEQDGLSETGVWWIMVW